MVDAPGKQKMLLFENLGSLHLSCQVVGCIVMKLYDIEKTTVSFVYLKTEIHPKLLIFQSKFSDQVNCLVSENLF